jgi:hypothetical protein
LKRKKEENMKMNEFKEKILRLLKKDSRVKIEETEETEETVTYNNIENVNGEVNIYNGDNIRKKEQEETENSYIMATKILNRFKESVDKIEKNLEERKNEIFNLNLAYILTDNDVMTGLIFDFKLEEIKQAEKNIDKLKEIYNKYKNKFKELEK